MCKRQTRKRLQATFAWALVGVMLWGCGESRKPRGGDGGGAMEDGGSTMDARHYPDHRSPTSCCDNADCVEQYGSGWRCDPRSWQCYRSGQCSDDPDLAPCTLRECLPSGECACGSCRAGERCDEGAGDVCVPRSEPIGCTTEADCPEGMQCTSGPEVPGYPGACIVSCEPAPPPPPPMDAGTCSGELTRCGVECVDTQTDPGHCGLCFEPCRGDETCVEGTCTLGSPDGGTPIPVGWVLGGGGPGYDAVGGLGLDDAGNLYVAGKFTGTVNLGGDDLTSAGSTDVLVASFGPDGTHRWSTRFGGSDVDQTGRLAVGPDGNVYVTGEFAGTLDFDGTTHWSAGPRDAFLASFDSDGVARWFLPIGGEGNSDYGIGVAVDSDGHVWVSGDVEGTVDFGDGTPIETAGGSVDVFVAEYGADGTHRWSSVFGDGIREIGHDIAIDAADHVYFTGAFPGALDFGDGAFISSGATDVFVVSFAADGTLRWSASAGGSEGELGRAVAVDGDGVWLGGFMKSVLEFGSGSTSPEGVDDAFVVGLGPDGVHRRSERLGGLNSLEGEETSGLDVDASGRVYAAGNFRRLASFGAGSLLSAGAEDVFVVAWNDDGSPAWSQSFGGPLRDGALEVVATDDGSAVYVSGVFQDSVDFGGELLTSAGDFDWFLVKLTP